MRKKSFTGLVILMGFSLLGIILVQFLWMDNAIKVRKEKFNATIYDALNATVQRLQREQEANYFIQQFLPPSNRNQPNTNTSSPKNGTTPFFPQAGEIKENSDLQTLIPNQYQEKNSISNKGTFEAHIQIQSNGQPQEVIITQEDFDLNNSDDLKMVEKTITNIEDSLRKALSNSKNSNPLNIFSQLSYEYKMHTSDPSSRINTKTLNRILAYELKARGIDLNYEYGILNRQDGTLTNHFSKTYNRNSSDFTFVANLFPNDFFRSMSPLVLDIYFPHQEKFIYKSLGLLLGSSLLFTLFILITFYFTLRTILNQKKLSEIKSDFINNMTHEFKTPIATINLATDNIANPKIIDKPEYISSFLKIIKEENKRMNNQVERVLQMSLIEKSDFQLQPIETDIHIIINEAVEKMKLLAEQKSAKISTNLKAEMTVFKVDEVHFTNVVVNLLENALKYTTENPEISVSTQNNKNGIDIIVKDNGIGMTKEQQAKVFEKFFRATRGNIHNVKGFGLGLSYVKAIMLQHSGNVYVKSKLGEGSEFKLFLPYK